MSAHVGFLWRPHHPHINPRGSELASVTFHQVWELVPVIQQFLLHLFGLWCASCLAEEVDLTIGLAVIAYASGWDTNITDGIRMLRIGYVCYGWVTDITDNMRNFYLCLLHLRILRILRMSLRILRMSYVFYVWITYILRMLTYISSAAKFWDFQNSRCGSAYVCGSCGLNYGWIRMLTDDTDPCGCLRIFIRKHPQLP